MHFGFLLIIAIRYYLWLSHSLLTHLDMFDRLYRIGTSPSPYRWQPYYFSLYQGDSLQWLKGYNYFEYQRTSFLCCHTCSIIFMIHIHAYVYIYIYKKRIDIQKVLMKISYLKLKDKQLELFLHSSEQSSRETDEITTHWFLDVSYWWRYPTFLLLKQPNSTLLNRLDRCR